MNSVQYVHIIQYETMGLIIKMDRFGKGWWKMSFWFFDWFSNIDKVEMDEDCNWMNNSNIYTTVDFVFPCDWSENNAGKVSTRFEYFLSGFASFFDSENNYNVIRSDILNKPTAIEQQMLSRITSIDSVNHFPTNTYKTKWDIQIIAHYKYEQRLAAFKRNLHELWQRTI